MIFRYFFTFCFLALLPEILFGSEASPLKKPTICLNMIVKNESEVICTGLKTVKPFIDYWVIVDTGSTDNTQHVIREFMKDIPGEVHDRPWVDFAHNRNEALQLAKDKGDYILWMDADDYLDYEDSFEMPLLTADSYSFVVDEPQIKYNRTHLIKSQLDWHWKGVLHEYLALETPVKDGGKIEGLKYRRTNHGARSKDPLKYQKDAQVLEKALEKEPENARYWFYLAQTYKNIGEHQKSLDSYQKRADMGGWQEEVFYSLLQIALIREIMEKPDNQILEGYLKAYLYRPSRQEPLYYLTSYFRRKKNYYAAYHFARQGLSLPPSQDSIFVEDWINKYGMLFEYSICSYWVGEYTLAKTANEQLLKNPHLPSNYKESVAENMKWVDLQLKARNPPVSPSLGIGL